MINNQLNKRGRQTEINVHSSASFCSLVMGEPEFSKICYC